MSSDYQSRGKPCYPVPEWLADRNVNSWRDIVGFYEYFAGLEHCRAFVMPMLRLVRQLAETEIAQSFRAGQSLWTLSISTAAQHGLGPDEPFVIVFMTAEGQSFQLEYRARIGGEVLEERRCTAAEVRTELERMLALLWANTRGRA